MHWYQYLLIIIILFLILLLISFVKIKIKYKKDNKNDLLTVDVWLFFNLIHYRREVPLIVFESINEGIKYKSNDNIKLSEKNEFKDRITATKLSRFHTNYQRFLAQIQDFYEVIKKFLSHIYFDRFYWKSTIGLDDAMLTGVFIGVIWSLKGAIIGLISKYMKLRELPEIFVEPVYHDMVLQSEFECILRFRVSYVFVAGIRIGIQLIKGGGKKWRENNSIPYKA